MHYVTDARFLLGLQRKAGLPRSSRPTAMTCRRFRKGVARAWPSLPAPRLRPGGPRPRDERRHAAARVRARMPRGEGPECAPTGVTRRASRGWCARQSPRRRRWVLCVGRLDVQKGQDLVLRALRLLERRGREFRRRPSWAKGPLRPRLEQIVADFGWQDRVTFAGHVRHDSDAFLDHLRRADLFAHPSVTVDGLKEGIPGAIVEAMASRAAGRRNVARRYPGRHRSRTPRPPRPGTGHRGARCGTRGAPRGCGAACPPRSGSRGARARQLDLVARTVELERSYARFTGASGVPRDPMEGREAPGPSRGRGPEPDRTMSRPAGSTPRPGHGRLTMDVREYVSVLLRQRRLVVAVMAVTLAAALAFLALRPSPWTAEATIAVEPGTAVVGGDVRQDDISYLDRLRGQRLRHARCEPGRSPRGSRVGSAFRTRPTSRSPRSRARTS